MICYALGNRARSITEYYNPLRLYSVYNWLTLYQALVVNLKY